MATTEEIKIPLKLVVDREKKKVVFAEGDKDFVDILFSFLALPMSTIVRSVRKTSDSESAAIGSLGNLYERLASLQAKSFWKEEYCKDMLLHRKNPCEADCCKLKLNIDDTHPTKYYVCGICKSKSTHRASGNFIIYSTDYTYAIHNTAKCNCGELMNTETSPAKDSQGYKDDGKGGGVFVTDTITYIVTDDLSIIPNLPSSIFKLLNDLGIRDTRVLEEITTNVGFQEILILLKWSLTSKSPLTDLFFPRPNIAKTECRSSVQPQIGIETTKMNSEKMMTLKVMVKKSDKKVLFAEAEEDFIDFLFIFLTIPLGSVGYLLSGETCMGSIDNLYRSISSLKVGKYFKSDRLSSMTSEFRLPFGYSCKSQLFDQYRPSSSPCLTNTYSSMADPRSGEGGGFIRGPASFMVTDDLNVTPFSSISSISILNQLGNPLSDIEEHVVSIGVKEGLSMLKASLNSTSALTNSLKHLFLNKPKHEN